METRQLSNKKIHLYVVCHKAAYVPDLNCLKPIQVGTACSKTKLAGMLYDNDGDNISDKNKSYCELTAQYWAWKNDDADYYGFFHYRRYFSFNTEHEFEEDGYGNILVNRMTERDLTRFQISDSHIQELIPKYDVITVRARDINENVKLSGAEKRKTNYTEYGNSDAQHIEDLDKALRITELKYPEFKTAIQKYMHDDKTYECNMFIMNKRLYSEYCSWLFDILSTLENEIDLEYYNQEEMRVFGFIAERLFGVYYTFLKENPSIRRMELQKILIQNTELPVKIDPVDDQSVPIVLASNDKFVPYLSTMIESILENANPDRGYDIIVLHRDISFDNQLKIKFQAKEYMHCSIRFANVQSYFNSMKLFVNQHLSVETYYRLVIQDLMPKYKKVLYLDADMVVECDVAQLYDIDMGEYMIGAVRDIDIAGQIKTDSNVRTYVEESLGLTNPFDYFQAGVLILNLTGFRKLTSAQELIKVASENEWKCHDQDVLNKIFHGKIYYLPQKWNTMMCWREGTRSRDDIVKKAQASLYTEYLAARQNPLIVHFAGYQKPWNEPLCDMSQYFWIYARKTPYYEVIKGNKFGNESDDIRNRKSVKCKKVLLGGIQCIKDHGFLYTCRYSIKKIAGKETSDENA